MPPRNETAIHNLNRCDPVISNLKIHSYVHHRIRYTRSQWKSHREFKTLRMQAYACRLPGLRILSNIPRSARIEEKQQPAIQIVDRPVHHSRGTCWVDVELVPP